MEKRKEIVKILSSLDGMEKASPGDFFFTRVQARLQRQETSTWGSITAFVTRPTVALATLCIIFLLNAAALFYQRTSSNSSVADQLEQNSADDYNTTLAANSYYDENTEAR